MCTAFDSLVITGDLNEHMDVAQNKQAKEFTAVLEMFGLTQHLTEPRLDWLKVGKGRNGEKKSWSKHRKGSPGEPNGNGASQSSRFIMRFTKKSYVCSTRLA